MNIFLRAHLLARETCWAQLDSSVSENELLYIETNKQ